MTVFSFDDSVGIGNQGAAVLDRLFHPEFIVKPSTEQQDRQGIDRFFTHRVSGATRTVDYKYDIKAGSTKNLALEDVSSEWPEGNVIKHGWGHTSIADYVVIFVPARDEAYWVLVNHLKMRWPEMARRWPPVRAGGDAGHSARGGERWISRVLPVQINWFKKELVARVESDVARRSAKAASPDRA